MKKLFPVILPLLAILLIAATGTILHLNSNTVIDPTTFGSSGQTLSNSNAIIDAVNQGTAALNPQNMSTGTFSVATLPNLWSLTFSAETQQEWFGIVDDAFQVIDWTGHESPPLGSIFDATVAPNGNALTVTTTSPWGMWGNPNMFIGPDAAIMLQVDAMPTSATASTICVGFDQIGNGLSVQACYDQIAGNLFLTYGYGGTTFSNTLTTAVGAALTSPRLGLTVNNRLASLVWQPDGNSEPQILGTTTISARVDFRNTATVSVLSPFVTGTYSGGTGIYSIKRMQAGLGKGSGIGNPSLVVWWDGEPVVKDGHLFFFVVNFAHPEVANNENAAIESMSTGIVQYDADTGRVSEVARFNTNIAGTVFAQNSGSLTVNADQSCELLVPNWANYYGNPGQPAIYHYHLPIFPRGNFNVSGGVALNLPVQMTNDNCYDPSLVQIGGVWTLMYVSTLASSGNFYCRTATSSDLVTWTAVGHSSETTPAEGATVVNWGGTYYYMAVSGDNWPVWDINFDLLGTISSTNMPNLSIQHPTIFPVYKADGTTEIRAFIWSPNPYPGVGQSFFGSQILIEKANNPITGAVFPSLRNLRE